jgi:putative toxin-antitoxin system antitoxin component (TIGR02293 family)
MDVTVNLVASALGLKGARTTLGIIETIREGLPVKALYRIASFVSPDDATFRFQFVPKATIARREKQPGKRLTVDEGGKVARVARVWVSALGVWGTEDNARAFLFRPHALLAGGKPIDVAIGTDLGAQLVEDILGRLKYSSAP